ncbi:SDR family NAD(P)-dependent oxidoreductase, partial [Ciceribacter azotifigens]|uniref:SDR family NAD(P)-dependent oxidoreductase n=1 Tax=Ciceribacter azotifigens TaxID=2069303 RepID=UPI003A84969B
MTLLDGKRVLVTASGQGIGRASALAFARAGASVVATDINEGALDSLAAEAKAEGLALETRVLDVLKDEAVEAIVSETGPFDVLFNCAGFVHSGTVLDMAD